MPCVAPCRVGPYAVLSHEEDENDEEEDEEEERPSGRHRQGGRGMYEELWKRTDDKNMTVVGALGVAFACQARRQSMWFVVWGDAPPGVGGLPLML